MKKIIAMLLSISLCICLLSGCNNGAVEPEEKSAVKIYSTASIAESGLIPALSSAFETEKGYKLELSGNADDMDIVLSNDTSLKDRLSVDGIPVFYDYLVVAGPSDDPMGVANMGNGSEALESIALNGEVQFVSTGNGEGINQIEQSLWSSTELDPTDEPWYVVSESTDYNGLLKANEIKAYTITDKILYNKGKSELQNTSILLSQKEDMENVYYAYVVSDAEVTTAFIEWLKSDNAKEIINSFSIDESADRLFTVVE